MSFLLLAAFAAVPDTAFEPGVFLSVTINPEGG